MGLYEFDKELLINDNDINKKLEIVKRVRNIKDKNRFSIVL